LNEEDVQLVEKHLIYRRKQLVYWRMYLIIRRIYFDEQRCLIERKDIFFIGESI